MCKIIVVIFIFTSALVFSQDNIVDKNYTNTNSISIRVDSVKELETISWQDIKAAFVDNDPESMISLEIKVKSEEKTADKSKYIYDFSYKSEGKSKEIDRLIAQMKKGLNFINKATKNTQNEN
ncbi:hypothetical protein [uncultured Polaribacter sp.]|uniref:hypothetical protein n=1 Tax=uncultured Polaribacter sp. TaxID=174711 RepID=UPI0030DD64F9|tara:strand:+ start:4930 stop:5298 length:369 start_codon:yes stop_codon:yes gene_type:complete